MNRVMCNLYYADLWIMPMSAIKLALAATIGVMGSA
jgi:hypothetical protein